MTQYRRRFVPGGTYFFTVCLADTQSDLLVERVDLLRNAVRICQKRRPLEINDAVILPAKAHMIWTLPAGDMDFSARWRLIKSVFSRHVPPPATRSPSALRRGEKGIWQRRFWEHLIRDQGDYHLHAHLIATAPLRAGLARKETEWPLCSAYQRRMRFNASPPLDQIRTIAPVP
ncbi:MAG: transposase [Yoonia sp.]